VRVQIKKKRLNKKKESKSWPVFWGLGFFLNADSAQGQLHLQLWLFRLTNWYSDFWFSDFELLDLVTDTWQCHHLRNAFGVDRSEPIELFLRISLPRMAGETGLGLPVLVQPNSGLHISIFHFFLGPTICESLMEIVVVERHCRNDYLIGK